MPNTKKPVPNHEPFMNLDDPHRKWFHPNTMGKQRKKLQYDMREGKKSGQNYKRK